MKEIDAAIEALPNLYGITHDIKDANTLLINRDELRKLAGLRSLKEREPVTASIKNKMPGGKHTDKWDSARVADYNSGWNDYRKAARDAIDAVEKETKS